MKKFFLFSTVILFLIITFQFVTRSVFATSANDTLVGYWKLDETSAGATAKDSSGDGHDGSPTNSPSPSTNTPYTTFPDPRSLSFNGSNQYLTMSSFTSTASSYTFSAWVYPTSLNQGSFGGGTGGTIIDANEDGSTDGYDLSIESTGKIWWWPAPNADLRSTGTVSLNKWSHIALTYQSGGTVKMYINGVLDSTHTGTVAPQTATHFKIGSESWTTGNWKGNLDDIRMYTRALSATEIAALAAGNHTSATWIGSTSTNYETASNWDIGAVPDPYTLININSTQNFASLSANESFAGMSIAPGGILNLAGFNTSMNDASLTSGLATSSGTLISKNSETLTNFSWPITGTIMYTNTSNIAGLTLGNTYNNLTFNDGLLGYWKLDESSQGSSAIDSSGYGNNGTPHGTGNGPTPSTNIPAINFTDNYSDSFNGSDQYIDVGTNSALTVSNNFTLSAWVKLSTIKSEFLFNSRDWNGVTDAGTNFGLIYGYTSGKFGFYSQNYTGTNPSTSLTSSVTDSNWHNIVWTYDGTTLKGYLDGTLDKSSTISFSVTNANPHFYIADSSPGGINSDYFSGSLDDIRIYNRALSATEVANLGIGNEPATSLATTTLTHDLTVNGNLTLDGGTIDAASANYNVTLGGNFENDGGVFTARSATVTLNGKGQSINSSNTFYNLTKTVSSADTLTFGQNSTSTISGTLTLAGAASNLLALRSSTTGIQFKIDPQGTRTLSYLNPQDSNNINATAIAYDSTFSYGTNLTNWKTGSNSSPTPTPTSTPSSNNANSASNTSTSCTNTLPTTAPNLFEITTSPTTAMLYFTPVSPSTGYVISYGTSSDANQYATSFTYSDTSGVIAYRINSLNQETTYYFKVQAINGCMPGSWSQTVSAITTGSENISSLNSNSSDLSQIPTPTPTPKPTKTISVINQKETASLSKLQECTYIVKPGDSFWNIAQKKLGNGNKYQTIIQQNLHQYPNLSSHLSPGMQLQIDCPSSPQPQTLTTHSGYDLAVQVENNGQPVVGAIVELHSIPMRTVTDKNGIARFSNVEGGNHTIALAYNGYKGQDKITVTGNKKDISINISIKLNYDSLTPLLMGIVIVILLLIIIILCIFLFKKKMKESNVVTYRHGEGLKGE